MLEEAALDRIRQAYRFAWSLPHTKDVMGRVSNLMIWSDVDLAEGFTRPDGGPALGTESGSWGQNFCGLRGEHTVSTNGSCGSNTDPSKSEYAIVEGRGGVSERYTVKWGPLGSLC